MRLLPLLSSCCPWPERRGLAKAEGLKTARLELFEIGLLMEDLLTGGSGGGGGVLTTGRIEELVIAAKFSGEGVSGTGFAVTNSGVPSVDRFSPVKQTLCHISRERYSELSQELQTLPFERSIMRTSSFTLPLPFASIEPYSSFLLSVFLASIDFAILVAFSWRCRFGVNLVVGCR